MGFNGVGDTGSSTPGTPGPQGPPGTTLHSALTDVTATQHHSNADDHSVNNVGTHGTANTGVHGVGAGTIAKTSDITATAVGLGNCNNTSDASKPVSDATVTALLGKAASSHSHAPSEITGTAVVTADSRLSDARTPLTHSHAESEVTNLVTDLGNKEPANANIQTHVTSAHAPSNAQKNSDITKAEIEAKLTGEIASHTHAGGSGETNIKQTEIDFGVTPMAEASFIITDASVLATSQLLGNVAYEAPTGKDLDELEMDGLDLKFAPGVGQFTLYARGLDGYIADKFKINYLIG